MDIYKYAEQYDADYFDMHTGNTYAIQEYNRARKLGLPTEGIKVYDWQGNLLGVAIKKGEETWEEE